MGNSINDIRLELDDAQTMKFIASAFMEASASRIQKIKKQFETNAGFYAEMSLLYHVVKINAEKAKEASEMAAAKHEGKKITTPVNRPLSVAMTSNQRFYGNLNVSLMAEFVNKTEAVDTDLLIVGSTGIDYMKSQRGAHHYKTFKFHDDAPHIAEIRDFLDTLTGYSPVYLYYPKFISLMRQTVGVLDITEVKADPSVKLEDADVSAIFEPELSKILAFFDSQIRQVLLRRVLLEIDLSRTAARLMTMSSADERSGDVIKEKKRELRKLQSTITNMKLLETFAAIRGAKEM